MRGFKCDKCGEWIEDTPSNEGHHLWLFADTPLYSMEVSAKVVLSEAASREGQDLCSGCLIECLEIFVRQAKKKENK